MKFYLLASILLGASARTATALEATCCYSNDTIGCPDGYDNLVGSMVLNGVQASRRCCQTGMDQVDMGKLCPGMPEGSSGGTFWGNTTSYSTSSGNVTYSETESHSGATSTSTTTSTSTSTTTGNTDSPSGAGIISSAAATILGASVAIIHMIFV